MRWFRYLPIYFLAIICALEILIFYYPVINYISLFHPRFNDQIQYLSESYLTYEAYKNSGFFGGVWYGITNAAYQGLFHDLYAFFFMTIFGANRSSALIVNIIFFIGWQASTFFVIHSIYKSNLLAIFAAMFLLAIAGIWNLDRAGSIFDYRLDHMAMCLMGITSMLQLKTDLFNNRKWSIIFGVLVGFTILTRILTSIYFLLIFICFFFYLICNKDFDKKRAIKNIILSGITAFLIAAPLILFNIKGIYEYYIVGHFTGVESTIRNSGLTFLQKLKYEYVEGVIGFQGSAFYKVLGVCLLTLVFSYRGLVAQLEKSKNLFIGGGIFMLCPMIILALEKQVSFVVLSILTPGLILLIFSLLMPILYSFELRYKKISILFLSLLSIVCFSLFTSNCFNYKISPRANQEIGDVKKFDQIISQIYGLSLLKEEGNLKIGSDRITDFIDAQVIRVVMYEKKGRWFDFGMTLPTGIFEEKDGRILSMLSESDIFFLTDPSFNYPAFPYDKQMIRMYPQIKEYCDTHFVEVAKFQVQGRGLTMYVSKTFKK